jgi:hypothetical protein
MLTYAVAFPPVFAATGKIYDDEGGISGRERALRVGLCVFIRQSILAVIIKEHQLGRTCYQPAAAAAARTKGKMLLHRHSLSNYLQKREKFANVGLVDRTGCRGNKSALPAARYMHIHSK